MTDEELASERYNAIDRRAERLDEETERRADRREQRAWDLYMRMRAAGTWDPTEGRFREALEEVERCERVAFDHRQGERPKAAPLKIRGTECRSRDDVADLIDDARDRAAPGDLSVIAYALLLRADIGGGP